MQVKSASPLFFRCLLLLMLCGTVAAAPRLAVAGTHDSIAVDSQFVQDLEQRAAQANPREQATLYADLVDKMTVLAGQEISAGEMEKAEQTLLKVESCTDKLKSGLLQNSKGLKRAELLLHTTQRRLQDLARSSSSDIRPKVQAAMKRLDLVQTAILGMIFEK